MTSHNLNNFIPQGSYNNIIVNHENKINVNLFIFFFNVEANPRL